MPKILEFQCWWFFSSLVAEQHLWCKQGVS